MAGLEAAFERIGAFLEHQLPRTHAAGASLAVTDRDEILGVVVRGFADVASSTPVRPETRFEIGSISKVFTSLLLQEAVDRGELALEDPASRFAPKGLSIPHGGGRQITLADLSTHMSGLPADDACRPVHE